MKLKELKPILQSQAGKIQWAIVYDRESNKDIARGCSIDYAIELYGERKVRRLYSYLQGGQDYIIVEV